MLPPTHFTVATDQLVMRYLLGKLGLYAGLNLAD